MLYTVNINEFTFKHPKYYKELRKRNKLDQAISRSHDCERELDGPKAKHQRALRLEAPVRASKLQLATSNRLKRSSLLKLQAQIKKNSKPQAPSSKLQAPSRKLTSSMILEPRKSFTVPGPRASTMINVLCG